MLDHQHNNKEVNNDQKGQGSTENTQAGMQTWPYRNVLSHMHTHSYRSSDDNLWLWGVEADAGWLIARLERRYSPSVPSHYDLLQSSDDSQAVWSNAQAFGVTIRQTKALGTVKRWKEGDTMIIITFKGGRGGALLTPRGTLYIQKEQVVSTCTLCCNKYFD